MNDKAYARLIELIEFPHSNKPFLNVGIGLIVFAKNYHHFYTSFFIKKNSTKNQLPDLLQHITSMMSQIKRYSALTKEQQRDVITHMWVYTHGLCTLICAQEKEQFTLVKSIELLEQMGDLVIHNAMNQ